MRSLFLAFLLLPPALLAQPSADWGAFTKKIDAKPYAGKKFRLQAAVKVQQMDTSAQAGLWARVDRQDKTRGFFDNMHDRPIRSSDWQVYTIEGVVDKTAEFLVFGGLYYRKGVFFFDQFRLFVETSGNRFEEVAFENSDFEADSLKPYWYYNPERNGFRTAATTETAFHGKQAIKIDGSRFKEPPAYGSNDSAGRYAEVNGIRLYYEEYGKGEPLLLLHGNQQSILAFTYQIPDLSKHYRVIAVDTRGQGRSTEDGKTYTYDLFAEDMKHFLDHLGLDSVNIVGWSDGGNTGLIMAMMYPQKVKRLITMGANIFMDESVVIKGLPGEIEKQIKRAGADTSYKGRNNTRLFTMLLKEPNHSFDELKQIRCPVLVMAGENDLIQASHTKGIADHIPKGTLRIAPKEGHYFPVNNPAVFNRVVLEYLKSTNP